METTMGGEAARLVDEHLPLVRHVVCQVAGHFPRHVDRDELATAGAMGLVEAARRYDPSRAVPFERFAARRIKGAILDTVRAADWAPRSVRNLARQLEAVEQQLAARLGRLPTPAETAEALGIDQAEVDRLQARLVRSVVLALDHHVVDTDEELTLVDVVSDDRNPTPAEELELRELLGYLRSAVALLPERHRVVITGYFFDGRTSKELAATLDVTESRISQLRSEALAMLRDGIEAQYEPVPVTPSDVGRAGRRRIQYAEAIAGASSWRDRLGSCQPPEIATSSRNNCVELSQFREEPLAAVG